MFVLALIVLFPGFVFAQEISVDRIKKDVTYLVFDKLKGRGTSTKGEKKAAKYIASEFEKSGLIPKGTEGYYQPFTFNTPLIRKTAQKGKKPRGKKCCRIS